LQHRKREIESYYFGGRLSLLYEAGEPALTATGIQYAACSGSTVQHGANVEQSRIDGRGKMLLVSGGILEGPPDLRKRYLSRLAPPAPPIV
jgi:hypothetical protein